jgi:hypothetical protein
MDSGAPEELAVSAPHYKHGVCLCVFGLMQVTMLIIHRHLYYFYFSFYEGPHEDYFDIICVTLLKCMYFYYARNRNTKTMVKKHYTEKRILRIEICRWLQHVPVLPKEHIVLLMLTIRWEIINELNYVEWISSPRGVHLFIIFWTSLHCFCCLFVLLW